MRRPRDARAASRTAARSHTLVDRPVVAVCREILGEDDEVVARAYGASLLLVFAIDHSATGCVVVIQFSRRPYRSGPSRRPIRPVAGRLCFGHQTTFGALLA